MTSSLPTAPIPLLSTTTPQVSNTDRQAGLIRDWLLSLDSQYLRQSHRLDLASWCAYLNALDKDLFEATRPTVDVYWLVLRERRKSSSVIARRVAAVFSFYAYLVSAQQMRSNPAEHAAHLFGVLDSSDEPG